MQQRRSNGHYRKPAPQDRILIPKEQWSDHHKTAHEHIRPQLQAKRGNSRLCKYYKSQYGSGTETILTTKITEREIQNAITSLQNRKSVGEDGITAETIKQNTKWAAPILRMKLPNRQIPHTAPKQWKRGVVAFIPKGKKGKTALSNFRPITLIRIIYKRWQS